MATTLKTLIEDVRGLLTEGARWSRMRGRVEKLHIPGVPATFFKPEDIPDVNDPDYDDIMQDRKKDPDFWADWLYEDLPAELDRELHKQFRTVDGDFDVEPSVGSRWQSGWNPETGTKVAMFRFLFEDIGGAEEDGSGLSPEAIAAAVKKMLPGIEATIEVGSPYPLEDENQPEPDRYWVNHPSDPDDGRWEYSQKTLYTDDPYEARITIPVAVDKKGPKKKKKKK